MGRFGLFLGTMVLVVVAVLGLASLTHHEVGIPGTEGAGPQIVCPFDNGTYVWTPMWSQNVRWVCLRDGRTWDKSYPAEVYQQWRKSSLVPEYVRDYTVLYLRQVERMMLPDPLTAAWTGGEEKAELTGNQTYVYHAEGLVVTIEYPWAPPGDIRYTVTVQTEEGTILWQGQLFQRQFVTLNCRCKVTP